MGLSICKTSYRLIANDGSTIIKFCALDYQSNISSVASHRPAQINVFLIRRLLVDRVPSLVSHLELRLTQSLAKSLLPLRNIQPTSAESLLISRPNHLPFNSPVSTLLFLSCWSSQMPVNTHPTPTPVHSPLRRRESWRHDKYNDIREIDRRVD